MAHSLSTLAFSLESVIAERFNDISNIFSKFLSGLKLELLKRKL